MRCGEVAICWLLLAVAVTSEVINSAGETNSLTDSDKPDATGNPEPTGIPASPVNLDVPDSENNLEVIDYTEYVEVNLTSDYPVIEPLSQEDGDNNDTAVLSSNPVQHGSASPDTLQRAYKLIEEGDAILRQAENRNIVLVLGNTMASKIALAQVLTFDKNRQNAEGKDDDDLHDDNDIGLSSTKSNFIYPELMEDVVTNSLFVVCPEFNEFSEPSSEIAANYLMKSIVDRASSVKIIFVLDNPKTPQVVDLIPFRDHFMLAAQFIPNVEKLTQNIGLVVSILDNSYGKDAWKVKDKPFVWQCLQQLKQSVSFRGGGKPIPVKVVKMINILISLQVKPRVTTNNNRIAILRRPNKQEPLSRNELQQMGRKDAERLVHDTTKFLATNKDDFQMYLSGNSKNAVSNILNDKKTSANFDTVARQVIDHLKYRENHTLDTSELYALFDEGHRLAESPDDIKSFSTGLDILQELFRSYKSCSIVNSKDNSGLNSKMKEFLDALKVSVGSKQETSISDCAKSYNDVKEYLNNSKNWYGFLNELHSKLSNYEIQQDRSKYNVANLEYWGVGSSNNNQGIFISRDNWNVFCDKIEKLQINSLNSVKGHTPSELQLTALNNILDITLDSEINYDYQDKRLVASGHLITMNRIVEHISKKNNLQQKLDFSTLEIIASDTVFIDSDLILKGKMVTVYISAPKWDVQGVRKIVLDGEDKDGHAERKANDGEWLGARGEHGKRGATGGVAGNFFGVGKHIINGEKLTISAIGGIGGIGQEGGDGKPGQDGVKPDLPVGLPLDPECKFPRKYELTWGITLISKRRRDWFYDSVDRGWYELYNITGTRGSRGGNGGNGGEGGYGGRGGMVRVVALEGDSKVSISSRVGKQGKAGEPGRGGKGGKRGCSIVLQYYAHYTFSKYQILSNDVKEVDKKCDMGFAESGEDGVRIQGYQFDGYQYYNGTELRFASYAVNNFKSNLREALSIQGPKKTILNTFENLENSTSVLDYYSEYGLLDDMKSLERHFYKLKSNVEFLPFYRSLLKRINYIAEESEKERNEDYLKDMKVLSYLYSAALSKVCSLKNGVDGFHIVDIRKFIDTSIDNIKTWKERKIEDNIAKHNENYQKEIKEKITSANEFIDKEITVEFANISKSMETQISGLINETIKLQNDADKNMDKLRENRRELQRVMRMREIFFGLNTMSSVVGLMGPWGEAISGWTDSVSKVAQHFALDREPTHKKRTKIPPGLEALLDKAEKDVKQVQLKRVEILKEKLQLMSAAVKFDPNVLGGEGTAEEIEKIIKEMDEAKSDLDSEAVEKLEKKLNDVIDKKEKKLKDKGDMKTEDVLKKIKATAKIIDNALDTYKQYKDDTAEMDQLNAALESEYDAKDKLRKYENSIYNTMWPMIKSIRETMTKLQSDLAGKSQVALDVSQWKMQGTLKDFKLIMEKFTEGFDNQKDIVRCIERLDEAMTTLIKVYDRIQAFQDQQKLANYIADVTSVTANNIQISNKDLKKGILDLDILINSNIILSQYERTMGSLLPYVFPFANFYLEQFSLPKSLQISNSTEELVEKAASTLETLRGMIGVSDATINQEQDTQTMLQDFKGDDSFYVWENKLYEDEISDLLSGKPVWLKADVTDSKTKNAVKFSEVEIRLKALDAALQANLDKTWDEFMVKMTHLGTSYYRCDKLYYEIVTESLTLNYRIKKNKNDEPVTRNNVYDKLKKGDMSLSPYAMWRVQFSGNLKKLQEYQGKVDVVLEGVGKYLEDNAPVCKTDLEKYYAVEDDLVE